MKRAWNANLTPGFQPAMCSYLNWGTATLLPVTLIYDPHNPARCQIVFALDETATGGGTITIWATGAKVFSGAMNVPDTTTQNGREYTPPQDGVPLELVKAGVNPFDIPLEELRAFKGSIWTARAAIDFGPRPGESSNILAMDEYISYNAADKATMIEGYVQERQYRHCPVGPPVDPGYHGQYPPIDFRADPEGYAAMMQDLWNQGAYPVLFMSPDNWSLADCENILTPIFSQPYFQRVVRLAVPYGWEPGGYNISNADWVARFKWAQRVFPNAILGIHMIADFDAPIGGDDGAPNGTMTKQEAWTNVYNAGMRFFLDQVAGYIDGGSEVPTPFFLEEFTKRVEYFKQHFRDWGLSDLLYIYGEGAAYADYWYNWNERYAVQIGDAAMAAGADGFFDGGTA